MRPFALLRSYRKRSKLTRYNSKEANRNPQPNILLNGMVSWLTESWPATISLVTWKWFALSVLLATSLRYLMQTMGQKSANPTNAALLMLLEPVWTLVLSVVIYQDNVIPKQPAVNNCKVVNNIGGSWLEKRLLKLKCSAKQHEAAKNHN